MEMYTQPNGYFKGALCIDLNDKKQQPWNLNVATQAEMQALLDTGKVPELIIRLDPGTDQKSEQGGSSEADDEVCVYIKGKKVAFTFV